jgi:hypothetical protein
LSTPHFPAPKENLAEGLLALQKGKAICAKTERKRISWGPLPFPCRRRLGI